MYISDFEIQLKLVRPFLDSSIANLNVSALTSWIPTIHHKKAYLIILNDTQQTYRSYEHIHACSLQAGTTAAAGSGLIKEITFSWSSSRILLSFLYGVVASYTILAIISISAIGVSPCPC
jgi:hypothetical protein